MVSVVWKEGLVFEASPPTGVKFTFDAHPESGGHGHGPTPVEGLLGAVAACSAMDVILILQKKKQAVHSYRIEVEGERVPPGTYPRPFLSLHITHILSGDNLEPSAVQRAVALSDEKYCSVIATLRQGPNIVSDWRIE